jgi:hypothetical protein
MCSRKTWINSLNVVGSLTNYFYVSNYCVLQLFALQKAKFINVSHMAFNTLNGGKYVLRYSGTREALLIQEPLPPRQYVENCQVVS